MRGQHRSTASGWKGGLQKLIHQLQHINKLIAQPMFKSAWKWREIPTTPILVGEEIATKGLQTERFQESVHEIGKLRAYGKRIY